MLKKMFGVLLAVFLLVSSGYALEIEGVNVPDSITADGETLMLNGAGTRNKFFMDLYVGSLYLPQPSQDAGAIIAADEPMAIRLDIISGMITSERMEEATREGFENATNGNTEPIREDIESFIKVFQEPIEKGDVFDLVYLPGSGVEIYKNGNAVSVVGDLEFKKALFGIWLCEKPAQKSLRKNMLGV